MMGITKAQALDVEIKLKNEFENEELYEKYLDENWHRILIHNLAVLSGQIQFLNNIVSRKGDEIIKNQVMGMIGINMIKQ